MSSGELALLALAVAVVWVLLVLVLLAFVGIADQPAPTPLEPPAEDFTGAARRPRSHDDTEPAPTEAELRASDPYSGGTP